MSLEIELPVQSYLSDNGSSITVRRKEYTDMLAQSRAINKLLSDAVEVTCYGRHDGCGEVLRTDRGAGEYFENKLKDFPHTHKALLINITEIKKETAADVLRDFVKEYSNRYGKPCEPELLALSKRAKKALEVE